jgi:hypothetical protein
MHFTVENLHRIEGGQSVPIWWRITTGLTVSIGIPPGTFRPSVWSISVEHQLMKELVYRQSQLINAAPMAWQLFHRAPIQPAPQKATK